GPASRARGVHPRWRPPGGAGPFPRPRPSDGRAGCDSLRTSSPPQRRRGSTEPAAVRCVRALCGYRGRRRRDHRTGRGLSGASAMSANLTVEDIEYLREGYRLFREHDPSYMDRFSADATFVFPTTLPAGGTYKSPCDTASFAAALAGAEPG